MVDLGEELPSSDAVVAPMVSDGQLPQVHILQGRLWACEWSGQPPTAEVMVDGKLAFVTDFRRRLHIDTPEPADPPLGKRHDWRQRPIEDASGNPLECRGAGM
jgi:hypothetical protein